MKFKLMTEKYFVTPEEAKKLEKLGFKFEDTKEEDMAEMGLSKECTNPHDNSINFVNLKRLINFLKQYGAVSISRDSIVIR